MPTLFPDETKSIIEALLFVSDEPLSLKTMAEIIDCPQYDLKILLNEIKADCERERKGFCLQEVAGGYFFTTRPEYAPYIEKLVKPRLNTLTQAALETLAIIAYQQPVTKGKIDQLRGVNSDSALNTLLNRDLIAEVGREEAPGRPILYGTTASFLKYMGLKDLQELPKL
ncbi:MAG TPA: SMC-Scp complex subunit ScpB [Clostridia bacterium]|jgi:segregation and condensation protein B|nr:SMC-Scp complex subunit ScpB [Clostridia bacterium]